MRAFVSVAGFCTKALRQLGAMLSLSYTTDYNAVCNTLREKWPLKWLRLLRSVFSFINFFRSYFLHFSLTTSVIVIEFFVLQSSVLGSLC